MQLVFQSPPVRLLNPILMINSQPRLATSYRHKFTLFDLVGGLLFGLLCSLLFGLLYEPYAHTFWLVNTISLS